MLSLVIASVFALGIIVGTGSARPATASQACDLLNTIPTQLIDIITVPNVSLDAGDMVSLTASAPSTGNPTELHIALNGTQAGAFFPGTATWTVPIAVVGGTMTFYVVPGTATLDISCTAAPPTATPTETPTGTSTESPTETPLVTETATIAETPEPGATEPLAT